MQTFCSRIDLNQPAELIRMVYIRLFAELAPWMKSEAFSRTFAFIEFLNQIKYGTIRDLADRFSQEKNIDAGSLVTDRLLENTTENIFANLGILHPTLSDLLLELMCMMDNGRINLNILDRFNRDLKMQAANGLMTRNEILRQSLKYINQELAPQLLEHGLHVDDCYVFRVKPCDEIVRECYDIAGMCDTGAFVINPLDNPQDGDCIYINQEIIDINADMLAFLDCARHFECQDIAATMDRCQHSADPDKHKRADLFRDWERRWTLWHESGHIKERRNDTQNSFSYHFNELYADMHALRSMRSSGDEAMERYLIIRHAQSSGIGQSEKASMEEKFRYLFILWAMLSGQPIDEIFTYTRTLASDSEKLDWDARKDLIAKESVRVQREIYGILDGSV